MIDIPESEFIADGHMAHRAFEERFGGRIAVLREDILFERAGIDADADRNAAVLRGREHLMDAVLAPDVAGVDAHLGDAGLDGLEREHVIEMDIGDDRDRATAARWPRIASAASLSFTVTRTMSHPASAAPTICATVPATSAVLVLVIVCTDSGAPPPTAMPPTFTRRVARRRVVC